MNRTIRRDLLGIVVLGVAVLAFSFHADVLETIVEFSRHHESWEIDEILVLSLYLVFALLFFALRRWREAIKARKELERQKEELHVMLSRINRLQEMVPICAWCKNIRDDEGFWHQVEVYVQDHTGAAFSHGICPECMEKVRREAGRS